MFNQHYDQMMREAVEAYPNEAVWFITEAGCWQAENTSTDPENRFSVKDSDTLRAMDEGMLAIVHSHPHHPPCPSEADMRGQIASGVPWGVIGVQDKIATPPYWWGDGVPVPDLRDRTFHHGITDCYSLIRDYYRVEMGILLPEYPRSWNWWSKNEEQSEPKNLYLEGFASAGFVPIAMGVDPDNFLGLEHEPEPGDMWFTQLFSPVPNHGGVYLGNGLCMHHLSSRHPVDPSRPVREEPIYRWASHVTHWFRHKERM